MRVVVTGGSGFIGSHVVDRLCAHGHEPVIYDLVPPSYHAPTEVETVVGDLLDRDALLRACRGADAIAHLAAVADVNRVVADPARAEQVNARGTELVLEAARRAGVARVLYASTVWVYGGLDGPVDEEAPLPVPDHLYTATKLAGELHCRAYRERYGLDHAILRFGIPYGPRARESTVVAAFVARALSGEPLTIAGDGTQARQFVYVEDLADGVVAALAPRAAGRTYNLVGSEWTSVREIARHVCTIVADVPIERVPARVDDLRAAAVSGERAARELGWTARTPFAHGVSRYVEWVRETNGKPRAAAASHTSGSAAAVLRQESGAL